MKTATAPKPATKSISALPASLLSTPDEQHLEKVEAFRRVLAALAAGEDPDSEDVPVYREVAGDSGFTEDHERFAIEALRSFPADMGAWPEAFAAEVAEADALEAKWTLEEQRLDLALTTARQKRRAAQHARTRLIDENRMRTLLIQVNPLLLGPPEVAAKSIDTVALTTGEAGRINGPNIAAEAENSRIQKMHYAKLEASGTFHNVNAQVVPMSKPIPVRHI